MQGKPAFYIGLIVVALTTSACVTPRATETLLHFTEQDRDARVLATHMRVNREYLRMDDGADGDFLLLDRGARTVYSVSAADQTILVIKPLPLALARPPVFVTFVSTIGVPVSSFLATSASILKSLFGSEPSPTER